MDATIAVNSRFDCGGIVATMLAGIVPSVLPESVTSLARSRISFESFMPALRST